MNNYPDNPELDCTDAAHPAWWRGSDYSIQMMCRHITDILDGKDSGEGTASPPWEPVRRRLIELAAANRQMHQALEEVQIDLTFNSGWICDDTKKMVVSSLLLPDAKVSEAYVAEREVVEAAYAYFSPYDRKAMQEKGASWDLHVQKARERITNAVCNLFKLRGGRELTL